MSRAQWFLISLPMMKIIVQLSLAKSIRNWTSSQKMHSSNRSSGLDVVTNERYPNLRTKEGKWLTKVSMWENVIDVDECTALRTEVLHLTILGDGIVYISQHQDRNPGAYDMDPLAWVYQIWSCSSNGAGNLILYDRSMGGWSDLQWQWTSERQ